MHIIATAGHVDHGKTTLVDALTGMRSDRLPEEQRRSISIELGYVWTQLPSVGDVAFVDVPGHERYITTSLAGLGPATSALLVVAADDPWMPQATEHLAALNALGFKHAVVAVTKCDIADPLAARQETADRLSRTSLAGSPIVEVSARTGLGLDRLRDALVSMLSRIPRPDPNADVRLWVDRKFTLKGIGVVVTGTLPEGSISRGDELTDGAHTIRVRGVQSLGTDRSEVHGAARVALNISGRASETLERGIPLITPKAWRLSSTIDIRIDDFADELPEKPMLHIGSAGAAVHLRPLAGPFARLQLTKALPLRVGDLGLLRDPGQRRLWGFRVLDPAPPSLQRRGSATERARVLATIPDQPSLSSELQRRGPVHEQLLRHLGVEMSPLPEGALIAGQYVVDAEHARSIRDRLSDLIREEEARGTLAGLTASAAAQRLELQSPRLVTELIQPPLHLVDGTLRHGGATVFKDVKGMVQKLADLLSAGPLAVPTEHQLRAVGLDKAYLRVAIRASLLVEISEGLILLPDSLSRASRALSELAQPFTVSQARVKLVTSRKTALSILAHLESTGVVLRLPDDRRVVNNPG